MGHVTCRSVRPVAFDLRGTGGVEMTDIVDYRVPLGPLGILLQKLVVGKKVEGIFEYRRKRLIELFGEGK